MNKEKALKTLDYAAAFFFIVFFAMLLSRYAEGIDFFPLWLIIMFLALFLITYIWLQKLHKKVYPPLPPPTVLTPQQQKEQKLAKEKESEENKYLDEAAHKLIVELCKSKNILLQLQQLGVSKGHYDIPEIWTIERSIPLTPEDLYSIIANRVLRAETQLHDDGIIYAHGFSRNVCRLFCHL